MYKSVGVRIVRVNFNLEIGSSSMFKISAISDSAIFIFYMTKPNDFKNSTFTAVSFFLNLLLCSL